jgi:DNA-binding PadR family transcriptional regulator
MEFPVRKPWPQDVSGSLNMEEKWEPTSAKVTDEAAQATLSADLLRGHTDTIVLRVLMHGEAYGFEIYNRILERTGEQYELKETTLYSSYKRLEADGCIESYWGDETQGARRKYYRITCKGREVFEKNLRDWRFTQKIINNLLNDDDNRNDQDDQLEE